MHSQKGSIIIFALLFLTVILAVVLTLTAIFLPKLRSIQEAGNSTVAIFAADTAAELCLYEARMQPASAVPRSPPLLTNGAIFSIASLSASPVDITNDCRPLGPDFFKFRAIGTFNGVSRAIEVEQ